MATRTICVMGPIRRTLGILMFSTVHYRCMGRPTGNGTLTPRKVDNEGAIHLTRHQCMVYSHASSMHPMAKALIFSSPLYCNVLQSAHPFDHSLDRSTLIKNVAVGLLGTAVVGGGSTDFQLISGVNIDAYAAESAAQASPIAVVGAGGEVLGISNMNG